jgi:hypothetical protein
MASNSNGEIICDLCLHGIPPLRIGKSADSCEVAVGDMATVFGAWANVCKTHTRYGVGQMHAVAR